MLELKADRYFTCPSGCRHKFHVEHLMGQSVDAGPWYCDECVHGWDVAVRGETVGVTPTRAEHKSKRPVWVLLEIPPQTEPIRLKVRGIAWGANDPERGQRYFYEEHTCPTNWLGDVEEVRLGNDDDPHGIARFVAAYDIDAMPSEGDERVSFKLGWPRRGKAAP